MDVGNAVVVAAVAGAVGNRNRLRVRRCGYEDYSRVIEQKLGILGVDDVSGLRW